MNKAFGLRIFLMQRLFNLNFEKTKFTKREKSLILNLMMILLFILNHPKYSTWD